MACLAAVASAVALGELLAGFISPALSPVTAVGGAVIDGVPLSGGAAATVIGGILAALWRGPRYRSKRRQEQPGAAGAGLTGSQEALLAVGTNGEPLPLEYGFPVRLVLPELYGYVSATKWVTELKATRFSDGVAY